MIENFLEIELKDQQDFLKIVETLTRIGIPTRNNELVQTCHLFHKRGKYYICHFKELFILDGVIKSDVDGDDLLRRNGIASLLEQWGLCKIKNAEKFSEKTLQRVKVIPFSKKNDYKLRQNYTVGNKKL